MRGKDVTPGHRRRPARDRYRPTRGHFMLAGPSPSVRMPLDEMDSRLRGNDGVPAPALARTSVRGKDVTAAVVPATVTVIPAEAGIQG